MPQPRPRTSGKIPLAVRYLVLLVFVVGALFPLYWVFVSSVKPNADAFKIPPAWAFSPTLGNYRQILGMTNSSAGGTDFVRYAVNSTIIVLGTAIPSLLLGTLAAYGITRCRVRWGGRYLTAVLVAGRRAPPRRPARAPLCPVHHVPPH